MARPSAPTRTPLGEAIRASRSSGQVELAEALGVARSSIARLERGEGRPSYDTAVKLAAWLGWTVEQVMQGSSGFEPSEHSDAKPTGFEPSAHSEDFRKR